MEYFFKYYPRVLTLFYEHFLICIITLLISLVISFPISLISIRYKKIGNIISKLFGIVYTIPSMVLLALLVPIIGLGMMSAIVALVLYTQFILIRNITKGLLEVPKEIVEAAYAMGMNEKQVFSKIKLPLAMPVILAGTRIATISIISMTTIAAWINAGGLGELIFEGLSQNYPSKIIIGTLLVAVLSIISNTFIRSIEKKYKIS